MYFVALLRLKGKVSQAVIDAMQNSCQNPPPGIKYHSVFFTLGQYDLVMTFEAPDEKEAMKLVVPWAEFCETQTMTAVPYKEALELLK
jgi:uncharacterized protein with GYD domain